MNKLHKIDVKDAFDEGIDSELIDLPSLVGREITLFSEQFPGVPLSSRVVQASNLTLLIDRSKNVDRFDVLINNQQVILQFSYRGEQVSITAVLKRKPNGSCSLLLGNKVLPLTPRRFRRYLIPRQIRLAVLQVIASRARILNKLRWMETSTINLSCGGLMLDMNCMFRNETALLINIEAQEFSIPKLLVAQVRHYHQDRDSNFKIGIEFLMKKESQICIKGSALSGLPPVVFEYDSDLRSEIDRKLSAWMQSTNKTTGVENESD